MLCTVRREQAALNLRLVIATQVVFQPLYFVNF